MSGRPPQLHGEPTCGVSHRALPPLAGFRSPKQLRSARAARVYPSTSLAFSVAVVHSVTVVSTPRQTQYLTASSYALACRRLPFLRLGPPRIYPRRPISFTRRRRSSAAVHRLSTGRSMRPTPLPSVPALAAVGAPLQRPRPSPAMATAGRSPKPHAGPHGPDLL